MRPTPPEAIDAVASGVREFLAAITRELKAALAA
jgi:hypothetical protein